VSGAAPETERERQLRKLAGRLLAHPGPGGLTTAELFVAELPPDAPTELVVPANLDLSGSLVRRREGQITSIEVITDGVQPIGEVLPAYGRELEAHGWRRWEPYRRHPPGGFEAGWDASPEAVFVNEKAVSALWIATRQVEGGRTEFGLRFDWENAANMMIDRSEPGPEPPGWDILPELRPPPGVRLQPQGSSGGGGHWSSEARAQSEMPVPELEAHFANQLTAAGWRRIAGAADDTTGWSRWDVPRPGNCRGLLLVLATVPGWRSLSVRVETFPGQNAGSSRTSVVSTLR